MLIHGAVCASHPWAVCLGNQVLRRGGNASDAAIATTLALCAADPANISLWGRCQILQHAPPQAARAINGATRKPRDFAPARRERAACLPVPGLPQALERLHQHSGSWPWRSLIQTVIDHLAKPPLAGPNLTQLWQTHAPELRQQPTASAYHHPVPQMPVSGLVAALGAYRDAGSAGLFRPALIQAMQSLGARWQMRDFTLPSAGPEPVLQQRYGDWQITTLGQQGWGHSLLQLLQLEQAYEVPDQPCEQLRALASLIAQAYRDRPQWLNTLSPKTHGLALAALLDPKRNRALAAELVRPLRHPEARPWCGGFDQSAREQVDQDTTHLSVLDASGQAVALTASIGPHFGARMADPVYGLLLAHSYALTHHPEPGALDHTEMCPCIASGPEGQRLVLGAAGSERIPSAVYQVLRRVIDQKMPLNAALAAPRVAYKNHQWRLHAHWPESVRTSLARQGFHTAPSGPTQHLGIVHAVARTAGSRWHAAADPAYDGAAWVSLG